MNEPNDILIYPRGTLRTSCDHVNCDNDEFIQAYFKSHKTVIIELADRLRTTLDAVPFGVGLAANQIGWHEIPMAYIDPKDPKILAEPVFILFPRILEKEDPIEVNEGCLSLPGANESLIRYENVVVEFYDLDAKKTKVAVNGFLAQIFQHEIDHLNGICFVDHLSPMKQQMCQKKVAKKFRLKGPDTFQWNPSMIQRAPKKANSSE